MHHHANGDPLPLHTRSVAIVGAGITGLTAADQLRQRGISVQVYEASDRPGGPIRSVVSDGYLAEEGPNTLLAPGPLIHRWIHELGLDGERLESNPKATRRYIVRHGRPQALPENALGWLTTPLFSFPGKFRVLTDLIRSRSDANGEESVADFVRRRLGQEMLDYAINPLIAGIYAGDPEKLSLREAFPRLHDIERRYRSLLLGQFFVARERRRAGEVPRTQAPKLSFNQGLETIVHALAHRLGKHLQTRSPVTSLRQVRGRWELGLGTHGSRAYHDAVLLTAPAYRIAQIEWGNERGDSLNWLRALPHAPIATLVLGFRREDVAHPLDGFGVLVPALEKIPILGVLFNSSIFPHRAPTNHVTITCYLGGSRDPELAVSSSDHQQKVARQALYSLLGVRGNPTFVHQRTHQPGIPQYQLGFARFREAFKSLESNHPGLYFAGYFRNGIALVDCITAGMDSARAIEQNLQVRPQ